MCNCLRGGIVCFFRKNRFLRLQFHAYEETGTGSYAAPVKVKEYAHALPQVSHLLWK